ncbi:MAG: MFS transporter [Fusobacteria bacterium]|nr:MFS transporter [Fusobacteriota bacterium]
MGTQSNGKFSKQVKVLFSIMFLSEIAARITSPMFTMIFFSSTLVVFKSETTLPEKALLFGTFILVYQLTSSVASPLLGACSDLIGRKKMLIFSSLILLFMPFGVLLALVEHSYLLFLIVFCIFGLFYSINTVSIAEISDYSTTETRVRNNSLSQFFIAFGAFVGPVLGGIFLSMFVTKIPFLLTFLMIAIFAIVTLFVIIFLYQDTGNRGIKKRKISFKPIWHLFKDKQFFFLIILLVLDQLVWGSFYRYSAVVSRVHFNFNGFQVGLFTGMLALFVVISSGVLLPVLSKFLKVKHIMFFSILMMLLGNILMISAIAPSMPNYFGVIILWISSFFAAAGDVLIFCLILSKCQEMVSSELQGSVVGIVYIIGNSMWAVNGFISGLLMARSTSDIFIFNSILAVILFVVYSFFPKNNKKVGE